MVPVSIIVNELILNDATALEALGKGFLNLSSYARSIHSLVEETAKKPVKYKTIVVALSRLAKSIPKTNPPQVKLLNLAIHSKLGALSCLRSPQNTNIIRKQYRKLALNLQTYFATTLSLGEITIIAEAKILTQLRQKLTGIYADFPAPMLAGVTVKFPIEYLRIPNVMATLIRALTVKDINLIEIVSTATELTFIVLRKDVEVTIKQLQKFL